MGGFRAWRGVWVWGLEAWGLDLGVFGYLGTALEAFLQLLGLLQGFARSSVLLVITEAVAAGHHGPKT